MTMKSERGSRPPNPGSQVRSPLPNVVSSTKQGAEAPVERGHWRTVFVSTATGPFSMQRLEGGGGWLGPAEWVTSIRYPSEAEARAGGLLMSDMCAKSRSYRNWSFARVEFFPDYGDA